MKKSILEGLELKSFLMLTVAGIINAFGVVVILSPVNLYDGGISGTSLLVSKLVSSGLWIWLIILNFPFFLFAFKKLGKNFVIYSLYAITVYSLMSVVFRFGFNLDNVIGSPIVGQDRILAAIFGGLLSGIGSGIVIRFGGAIDGIEVMSVMFSKKLGMTVGGFVMTYNVVLYLLAAFVFSSAEIPLYSVVAYAVGLKAVDFVVDGLDKAKAAFIITEKGEAMTRVLSKELGRGLTILKAKGYYSKVEKNMLYCVVNRFEISKLKKLVSSVDSSAFVTISDISEIVGTKVGLRNSIVLRKNRKVYVSKFTKAKHSKKETLKAIEPSIIEEHLKDTN